MSDELSQEMITQIQESGSRARFVSIERLREIETEIHGRHANGEFDEHFYRVELEPFAFELPADIPSARALVIVATPQPQVRVSFSVEGNARDVIIPPTYSYATDRTARSILDQALRHRGFSVARAKLPLKLLAVRSGLATYGRNNIAYVDGMGSFHRLTAYYTDAPCGEDAWAQAQTLKPCSTCTACEEACPTGAITGERFLIRGERCITFLNEFPGEFPNWLDPAWHNCLVGCLHCQRCCPLNSRVAGWIIDGETFTEEETALLLRGGPEVSVPMDTARKLERLGMLEYLELLPRNLNVLFRK
jgi:epoxyqueuosine reductase